MAGKGIMPAMRMAFVDLETTGATATADRITEVGIIQLDDTGTREWSSLVNPEARISDFIERLTGISNAMVATAPRFEELAPRILDALADRVFVAHNARFDYSFLKAEFGRLGIDFRPRVLCTVKLSRRLFPQHRKHSLDSLIERHGLSMDQRHRALGDARAIAQFWQLLREQVAPEELDAAVRELTGRPSLPQHIEPAVVDALPDGPGVYLFYGENRLPLYIGKSRTLKKRVLTHFASDHSSSKEMSLAQQVRQIECITTAGEIGALLQEALLVKRLQPSHNRRLRRNDDLCSWQYAPDASGRAVPRLLKSADADLGYAPDLYGLFKTPREATLALRALADEEGLCHGLLGLEKLAAGRPCFAHQLHKCRGACVGKEAPLSHAARLMTGLARMKLLAWPFPGPATLAEGDDLHVIDAWCYLGTARSAEELAALRGQPRPAFDRDIYQVLRKHLAAMNPL